MRSHIWHLFKKDGTELLRDRRTLFVNIILPVLLFPLVMLFMIQVTQLTRGQPVEPPRVAVIDAQAVEQRLPVRPTKADAPTTAPDGQPSGGDAVPQGPDEAARMQQAMGLPGEGGPHEAQAQVAPVQLDAAVADDLRARVLALREHALTTRSDAAAPTPPGDRPTPSNPEVEARLAAERGDVLRILREHKLAAAVVAVPGDGAPRIAVVKDEAHGEWDQAESGITHALDAWRRQLIADQLARVALPESVLTPIAVDELSLAPRAETLRSRLAGIIPLLLVIMAASGAFYPALDLFAGERERGTLESLLSWPVRRRDIFLGKLGVACVAAVVSVVLNLLSLGLTTGIAGSALAPAGSGGGAAGLLSVGFGTLLLCFLALLPLVVTLATISLALAGYAASAKEAQNYLTPLMLVVLVAAGVAAMPGTRPSLALDLVPITGPVLALKESLRSSDIPWLHLALSTASSVALSVVIVGWAARLLESERFCYPGLVRAGWGRFRSWGAAPDAAGAIEAMGMFAVCVGVFTLGSGFLQRQDLGPALTVSLPLMLFIAAPTLIHRWLGGYPARTALHWSWPRSVHWQRTLVCIPLAVICAMGLGIVTDPLIPDEFRQTEGRELERVLGSLHGLPKYLAIAVVPGICEELLCRGLLLSALRRSIGGWGAAVVSAFLFAILHLSPYRFVPQFSLGVILALITLRCGSILPAMLLHVAHNALQVWLGEPVQLWLAKHLGDGEQASSIIGLVMGVFGWLAMFAIVALPEPRRRHAPAIAPSAASTTPVPP